jgi:hypothetical protein
VSEVEQFFMKNNPTCSKIVKEKPGEEEKEPKCVGI